MKVPFCDSRVTGETERRSLIRAFERLLDHGRFCPGAEVEDLERRLAARLGRARAVAVRSGPDALRFVLRARGIGRGAEVLTSPFCPPATLAAIRRLGAKATFGAVGDDLTLDPASLAGRIGPRTGAILPVHWGGRMADMDGLLDVAGTHGLPVIEDCFQAFGAERMGHKAGGSGLAGCFDLRPGGILAALGEAGMMVTDDADLAEKVRCQARAEAPPDVLQTAMLLQRIRRVDGILLCREENARYYDEHLKGLVSPPEVDPGERHAFVGYALRTPKRDRLRTYLERRGIATLTPEAAVRGRAARPADKVLAIPVGEHLTRIQRIYVAETIRRFFRVKGL
jgi:dTDP-4-amino-4,6-dideoxygalactose transaminase